MNQLAPESLGRAIPNAIFPRPVPLLGDLDGAEEPVEDHQMRREILVIGVGIHAMMPLVEIRSRDEPTQMAQIDPRIGMVEKHLKTQNAGIDQQRAVAETEAK